MKKFVATFVKTVLLASALFSFASCGGGGGGSDSEGGGSDSGESYTEPQREAGLYLPSILLVNKYKENTFNLGRGNVTKSGTIFSVYAEGGYFTLTQTEIEGNAAFNMGIPVDENGALLTNFVDANTFNSDKEEAKKILFRYIQYTSTSGDITFTALDEFLSSIDFHKIAGQTLKIRINLETVPIVETEPGGSPYELNKDVFYLDGSFYKKSERFNDGIAVTWANAYDSAKQMEFNGLKGYLIAITSDAENKFVYDQVFKKERDEEKKGPDDFGSWIGGTRCVPQDGYDAETWVQGEQTDEKGKTSKMFNDCWVWACGPEAGQVFYTKPIYRDDDLPLKTHRAPGMYSSWSNPVDCSLNGIEYYYDGSTDERGKNNGADFEPNNKTKENHTKTYEEAMKKQEEYYAQYTGRYVWNDAKDGTGKQKRWQVHYYVVEFTPYGEQKPTAPCFHAEQEYK
ncbi:MAG: hypothetical protein K6E22_03460 [Treponema sp.]|nr:hypothetical protein [Treponema sp.]